MLKEKLNITVHLPQNLETPLLEAVKSGRYASLDDAMAEAASLLIERMRREEADLKPPVATQPRAVEEDRPIWEIIEEENRSIPSEVWDALPTDLAEQHDHYLYGTPKRPAR